MEHFDDAMLKELSLTTLRGLILSMGNIHGYVETSTEESVWVVELRDALTERIGKLVVFSRNKWI